MIVLSTCVKDPLKGALAFVGVALGRGVLVGGTREKEVFVGIGVMVGRGVSVGVSSRVGLGVHVGWSCKGVTVNVGGGLPNNPPPGGKIFSEEAGFTKIIAKYPTRQTVRIKTRIDRISQICMGAAERLV